jgi:hypothetical protein
LLELVLQPPQSQYSPFTKMLIIYIAPERN